jgi:hypothetical protein
MQPSARNAADNVRGIDVGDGQSDQLSRPKRHLPLAGGRSLNAGSSAAQLERGDLSPSTIQLVLTSSVLALLLLTLNEKVESEGIVTVCVKSVHVVECPIASAHVRAASAPFTSCVTLVCRPRNSGCAENRTEGSLAVIGTCGEICSTSAATSAGAIPDTGPKAVAPGGRAPAIRTNVGVAAPFA